MAVGPTFKHIKGKRLGQTIKTDRSGSRGLGFDTRESQKLFSICLMNVMIDASVTCLTCNRLQKSDCRTKKLAFKTNKQINKTLTTNVFIFIPNDEMCTNVISEFEAIIIFEICHRQPYHQFHIID